MKPVLYRYRDSESVITSMEGYTPGEGWGPLYDQAEMDAAVAEERERCAKFGDPAASDTIQKETRNVTITPVSFAGGSCPGPVQFTAFGQSYQFSYGTLCGKLAALSSLFLALAGLTAAWIFTSGFRV